MKNKKSTEKESEKSRLGRVLAEAKRRTAVTEELEFDDEVVVAMAQNQAYKKWPEILETIGKAVKAYLKGEGPSSIKVGFKVVFLGRDGLVWAAAYEAAIRSLLPEGFYVENDQTIYGPDSDYSFSINW